jgi:hypothetical protein
MFGALALLSAHYYWILLLLALGKSFDAVTYFFSSIAIFPGYILQFLHDAAQNW